MNQTCRDESVDHTILEKARLWTTDRFDERTRAEVRGLIESGNEQALTDRFYRDLEFGTGGMRGVMEAGSNRMNVYTVGRATQGLAEYLLSETDDVGRTRTAGVAIAHDSRKNSGLFAREAARVLAANGIRVYLFRELRPTPLLSFSVRHLGCAAGIVLTASHNPREYNGYKVYGADGGQVTNPEDARIVEYVNGVDIGFGVKRIDYDEGMEKGLIDEIGEDPERAYLERLSGLRAKIEEGIRGVIGGVNRRITVVYTPLHGTGITLVPRALERMDVRLVCEEEQSIPDGDFPTTPSPNPEDPVALQRAIARAGREKADLVVATDPDCDRMGVAVPDGSGGYVCLTGNQVGCLFAYLLAVSYRTSGRMPDDPVIISTIVSTPLAHGVAADFGISVFEVLTGFKYIARKIKEYESRGTGTFLYAFEESYGYLADSFVRDKDGVIAVLLAVMLVLFAEGRSKVPPENDDESDGESRAKRVSSPVLDLLYDLYRRYGLYREFQKSFTFTGAEGAHKIHELMERLRSSPPSHLGGRGVTRIRDFLHQREIVLPEKSESDLTELPVSDVLQFLTDEVRVSVRPSGTEPKIKFYFALKTPVGEKASSDAIEESMKNIEKRFDEVAGDLFSACQL
jgi:phosphoglucomutase